MRLPLLGLGLCLAACSQHYDIDEVDGGCDCSLSHCTAVMMELDTDSWLEPSYVEQLRLAHEALWQDKTIYWSTPVNGLRLGISVSATHLYRYKKLRVRGILENVGTDVIELEQFYWGDYAVRENLTADDLAGMYLCVELGPTAISCRIECALQDAMHALTPILNPGDQIELLAKTCLHEVEVAQELAELYDGIHYEELYWNYGDVDQCSLQLHFRSNIAFGSSWRGQLTSPTISMTIYE